MLGGNLERPVLGEGMVPTEAYVQVVRTSELMVAAALQVGDDLRFLLLSEAWADENGDSKLF